MLVLLVNLLHRVEVQGVILEDHHVLVVEVLLQALALENRLKLTQEQQGLLGTGDVLEGGVDEILQLCLEIVNVDVELQKVAIVLVLGVIQQVVRLALELVGDNEKPLDHPVHPVDGVRLRQSVELVNRREHVDELVQALGEELEFGEDLLEVEIELTTLGLLRQTFARVLVLLLVLLLQVHAQSQALEQRHLGLVPQRSGRGEILFAVVDHLIRHLLEERRHALRGVVIPRHRVHHLDVVQQRGQPVQDLPGLANVHWLQRLLQRGEVLDVIFRLVCRVRHFHVDRLPLLVRLRPRRHGHPEDQPALVGFELLGDGVKLRHATTPVLQLRVRPGVVRLFSPVLVTTQQLVRALAPVLQHHLHVRRRLRVLRGGCEGSRLELDGLHVLPRGFHQLHPALQRVGRLRQRRPELGDALHELVRVLLLRLAPLRLILEHGDEEVRHEGAERVQRRAANLARHDVLLEAFLLHALGVRADEVHGVGVGLEGLHLSRGYEEPLRRALVHHETASLGGGSLVRLAVEEELRRSSGVVKGFDFVNIATAGAESERGKVSGGGATVRRG